MFAILKAFLSKLDIFKDQIAKGNSHISVTVKHWLLTMKLDWDLTWKIILKLQSEFANSFCDLQKHETVTRSFENPFALLPTNVDSCFPLEL